MEYIPTKSNQYSVQCILLHEHPCGERSLKPLSFENIQHCRQHAGFQIPMSNKSHLLCLQLLICNHSLTRYSDFCLAIYTEFQTVKREFSMFMPLRPKSAIKNKRESPFAANVYFIIELGWAFGVGYGQGSTLHLTMTKQERILNNPRVNHHNYLLLPINDTTHRGISVNKTFLLQFLILYFINVQI